MGRLKHGLSRHPAYDLFYTIKSRCYSTKNQEYKNYGGRGITICDEWLKPKGEGALVFVTWALNNGYKKGLQIDRIDNNGNYEPSNCRFVSPKINSNNQRSTVILEAFNDYGTLSQLHEKYGVVKLRTLKDRFYKSKWPLEKALKTPGSGRYKHEL